MRISEEDLHLIYFEAANLYEKYGRELSSENPLEQLPLDVLAAWDRQLSRGEGSLLKVRLDGIERIKDEVRKRTDEYKNDFHKKSSWIRKLERILKNFPEEPDLDVKSELPFYHILSPFLESYSKEILTPAYDKRLITSEAVKDFQQIALKKLSDVAGPTFIAAFESHRPDEPVLNSGISDSRYLRFITDLCSGELVALFSSYPVLARMIIRSLDQIQHSTTTLIRQYEKDQAAIHFDLLSQSTLAPIKAVESGLSADHGLAGPVMLIRLATGDSLLYKPRSGAGERFFTHLSAWLDKQESGFEFQAPKQLDFDGGLWQEYIPKEPCQNTEVARSFYKRIGKYAALFQVLGSRDYHYANLIAKGSQPVFVDHESIFCPGLYPLSQNDVLENSIARSGLLAEQALMDTPENDGITGAFADGDELPIHRIEQSNTDAMHYSIEMAQIQGKNKPTVKGRSLSPLYFEDDILESYSSAITWIGKNKEKLNQFVKEATSDFSMSLRIMIRPTRFYFSLLHEAKNPEWMKSGYLRSIHFEKICPSLLQETASSRTAWLEVELQMLENNWIPWLHQELSERIPRDSGKPFLSSKDVFESNLEQVSKADWQRQQVKILSSYLKDKEARQGKN